MVPEGLNAFWTFVHAVRAPLRFFSRWECPKMGFFLKDRRYRAFFVLLHKRNFSRMVPEGLNAFWTFVRAAETASNPFLASGEGQKCCFYP